MHSVDKGDGKQFFSARAQDRTAWQEHSAIHFGLAILNGCEPAENLPVLLSLISPGVVAGLPAGSVIEAWASLARLKFCNIILSDRTHSSAVAESTQV